MDETEDLNRLIRELNEDPLSSNRLPVAAERPAERGDSSRLDRWLSALVERQGADLLLVAGAPPSIRVDGRILPLSEPTLSGEDIEDAVLPALPRRSREVYRAGGIADASHHIRAV